MRTLSGLLGSGFIFLNSLGVPAGDPARFLSTLFRLPPKPQREKQSFLTQSLRGVLIRKNEFRPPSIIKSEFLNNSYLFPFMIGWVRIKLFQQIPYMN